MPRNLIPDVCPNAVAALAMLSIYCGGVRAEPLATAAKLTVRVYNYANVPAGILANAEKETALILHDAGIELSWVPCAVSDQEFAAAPSKFSLCVRSTDAPIVRIEAETNGKEVRGHESAVAGRAESERVAVSYGKVEEVAEKHQIERAIVLGNVMAHELGHLLLGESSHSSSGIMTANFRRAELESAERGKLRFSPRQAAQMRNRLLGGELRAGMKNASEK